MTKQFSILFSIILCSLIALAISTDYFLSQATEHSETIEINDIQALMTVDERGNLTLTNAKVITLASLEWPPALSHKLAAGKVISLMNQQHEVYYYWQLNSEQVVEFGPVSVASDENTVFQQISLVFYCLFAIVLAVVLWPMFNDIHRLIHATKLFSKDHQTIHTHIKRGSLLFPLAKSVESMSAQINRFLSLQRFLASSLSHDIRTPLSRISFLNSMSSADNLAETKQRIELDIDEIDKLTDEFIELARLEEEHHLLSCEVTSYHQWLRELIEKCTATSQKQITFQTHTEIHTFSHDTRFLTRALQNLIQNALTYAEQQVVINVHNEANCIVFTVHDDGAGISLNEQATVLGLYERGKAAASQGSGYGIGLAFVNVIAQWHEGFVTIKPSKLLSGAAVAIYLPLQQM